MARVKTKFLPGLIYMTDENRGPDPAVVVETLAPGTAVIFRHYRSKDRERIAAALARQCKKAKLPFLVAGDLDLARKVGADGLHLPERDLAGVLWRSALPAHWIVTAAVHNIYALKRARDAGVDAVLLSPVFDTASHPKADSLGPHRFARLARRSRLPVYALGGIGKDNLRRIPDMRNLAGFAGISIFLKK